VFGKLLDCSQIATDSGWGVVAALKFVEHALTKWVTGISSCDLHPSRTYLLVTPRLSSRRASGSVLTGFSDVWPRKPEESQKAEGTGSETIHLTATG
jgi:hypothetical protein